MYTYSFRTKPISLVCPCQDFVSTSDPFPARRFRAFPRYRVDGDNQSAECFSIAIRTSWLRVLTPAL